MEIAFALISYLAGSIPTGYLLGKALKGIDIREEGSKNPGATNVFRTVGWKAGAATLAIDFLKGGVPVFLAMQRSGLGWLPPVCGAAAVIGHTWSPFLGFKGGKGVATSAGALLALLPAPTLAAFCVFGLGFGFSRRISVGSILAAIALPPAAFYDKGPAPASFLSIVLSCLVLFRHIPNMKRIWRGEEAPLRIAASRDKEP